LIGPAELFPVGDLTGEDVLQLLATTQQPIRTAVASAAFLFTKRFFTMLIVSGAA
jgi:hypothetical protein